MNNNEPAISVGSITAAATAIVALLVAFGLPISDEQTAAILGVVAVVVPLIGALITRKLVTPAKNVVSRRTKDGSVEAGPAADAGYFH